MCTVVVGKGYNGKEKMYTVVGKAYSERCIVTVQVYIEVGQVYILLGKVSSEVGKVYTEVGKVLIVVTTVWYRKAYTEIRSVSN